MDNFFSCYFWWLLLGILIGFFLFWLYDLLFHRDGYIEEQPSGDSGPSANMSSVAPTMVTPPVSNEDIAEDTTEDAEENPAPDLSAHMNYSEASLKTAAGFDFKPSKSGKDQLTVVEGIGPKISQLLIADGIETFRQLEQTPESRLQAILDAAGPSFKLAVPQSWPRQAGLCVVEDWQELREYQDRLFNGIEVKK